MSSLRNLRKKFAHRPTYCIELDESSDSDSSESSEISPTVSPTRSYSQSDLQSEVSTKTSGTYGASSVRVNVNSFGKLPNPGHPSYKYQLAVNIHLKSKMPKPPKPGTKEYDEKLTNSINRAKQTMEKQLKQRRKIVCLD